MNNKLLIENAVENMFRKNLNWLKNEVLYMNMDENNIEVVPFNRVEETCTQICNEIVKAICSGDNE